MCYPKPGPRCSAHARTAYVKARYRYLQAPLGDYDNRISLKDDLEKAEHDFYMTPAGFRELERLISVGGRTEVNSQDPAYVLKHSKEARRLSLEELKAADQGDIKHELTYNHDLITSALPTTFLRSKRVRRGWKEADKGDLCAAYIEYSATWVDRLSPEEIAAARWLTSNGSSEMAEYLTGNITPSAYAQFKGEGIEGKRKRIEKNISFLDAALAKHTGEERIVYRGVSDYFFPKEVKDTQFTEDYAKTLKKFTDSLKEKGTIEFNSYLSTSLDSNIAANFGTNDVIFEMKTSRAVPVGVASAWQATEREMIIPRNTKFRIVNILENVVYEDTRTVIKGAAKHRGLSKEESESLKGRHRKTVIQLEEIVD